MGTGDAMRICDRCKSDQGVDQTKIPSGRGWYGEGPEFCFVDLCARCKRDFDATMQAFLHPHKAPAQPEVTP